MFHSDWLPRSESESESESFSRAEPPICIYTNGKYAQIMMSSAIEALYIFDHEKYDCYTGYEGVELTISL